MLFRSPNTNNARLQWLARHFSPSAHGAGKSAHQANSLIKDDKVEAGGEAGLVAHQLRPGRTGSKSDFCLPRGVPESQVFLGNAFV